MSYARLLLLSLGALLLAACLGRSVDPKAAGSALWLASDSGALTSSQQAKLSGLGLREVFLDAGDLEWSGGPAIRRRALPDVPRRTASTLVVHGSWLPGGRDAADIGKLLHTELLALRIEAEQAGVLVTGFHFEVDPGERGESFAKSLATVRRKLAGSAFLSVGLDRRRLQAPEARAIAASADFVVCFLYGQHPGEAEDPGAWDLESVEQNFRRLEALDRPYLTGAITLGTAYHKDSGGSIRAWTTMLDLGTVVRNPAFELKPGFSLQGIDRLAWEFVAQERTTLGDWTIERGDSVRLVRTATPLIEEFRRRVGAWESDRHLGEIYYRLPRPGERLSLSGENLVVVLSPESSAMELNLALGRTVASREVWIVTARLENRSAESSDLALFDNNYVQLDIEGAIAIDAEPGGFRRVELLRDGERGSMQALRAANQVRLFLPFVEGGQVAESGPITLRLREPNPRLRISASFLLAEGRLFATDPIDWSFTSP